MVRKMTTGDVLSIYTGLEEFIKKDIELPVQFAWNLEDNFEQLKKIVDRFTKKQQELLQPLQEKGAFEIVNDTQIKVANEYADEVEPAVAKVNEFAMTENDINVKMVKRSEIPDAITVKDLMALKFMIDDDDVNDESGECES